VIKKTFLAILVSLFCFMGTAFQVKAEQMYILDNMSDTQTATTNTYAYGFDQLIYPNMIQNHKYYISFTMTYNGTENKTGAMGSVAIASLSFYFRYCNNGSCPDGFYSSIITYTGTTSAIDRTLYVYTTSTNGSTNSTKYENMILIDLTATFGAGFEPSISDFESLYLPDQAYFDEYTSFDPDNFIQLDMIDYVNMGTDLTGLDYTKSVIDVYGDNMDVSVSMYVYATSPASHSYDVDFYIANNFPEICYLSECETLSWVESSYSEFVLDLVMTDAQELMLKKILFNRSIDVDNEYFNFDVMASAASYSKVWIALSSAFDLRVDIESILVSRDIYTENAFNLTQYMTFKAYDKYNSVILPAVKLLVGDVFETRLVDDFGSQYTDVSRFNLEFELTSPDYDDTYTMEKSYLYELGVFSSDTIIQPGYYDTELERVFTPKTCEWYELGCQAMNGINSMLFEIWVFLDVDAIIATFDDIIESAQTLIYVLPSVLSAIVLVVITGASVGLVIIIIDRL